MFSQESDNISQFGSTIKPTCLLLLKCSLHQFNWKSPWRIFL